MSETKRKIAFEDVKIGMTLEIIRYGGLGNWDEYKGVVRNITQLEDEEYVFYLYDNELVRSRFGQRLKDTYEIYEILTEEKKEEKEGGMIFNSKVSNDRYANLLFTGEDEIQLSIWEKGPGHPEGRNLGTIIISEHELIKFFADCGKIEADYSGQVRLAKKLEKKNKKLKRKVAELKVKNRLLFTILNGLDKIGL